MPTKEPGEEITCVCFGIADREIEKAVKENRLTTVEDVTNYTKAGDGCGNCHEKIREIIERVQKPRTAERPKLSNLRKIKMIEELMERDIRPSLRFARR